MALRLNSKKTITLKIDKLGRILIPQGVRERLGLTPGTTLKLVEENDKAIYLEPVQEEPKIIYKNGVPVIASKSPGTSKVDIVGAIHRDREERMNRIAGIHRDKK